MPSGLEGQNPEDIFNSIYKQRFFSGIKCDLEARMPVYKSDWTDGLKKKSFAATMFLYFACLAPCIAFGGLTNVITEGSIGVVEFLVSCGASGIIYAILAGQPMTFIGPTGLTLAFTSALFRFTSIRGLPFLPIYSWVGLWTSLFLFLSAGFNLTNLIHLCTRFTDDVFNALLSINFVYEACRGLIKNFQGGDLVSAFASMNMAIITWLGTKASSQINRTSFFNKRTRKNITEFGPSFIIVLMSIFTCWSPISQLGIKTLQVPRAFALSNNRAWIPSFFSVPLSTRVLCGIPAFLLTMLFYLDQNISVRATNTSPGMKKGAAYHLDLLVLSGTIFASSLLGLPWMCGATVQSLNHVRSMTTVTEQEGEEAVHRVTETRITGVATHAMILGSVLLLPILTFIPLPVISGIFLYVGTKMMGGNLLLDRCKNLFVEKKSLPASDAFSLLPKKTVGRYIGTQLLLLQLIWFIKQTSQLALFFPSVIACLAYTRWCVLPDFFTYRELDILDPEFN
jgi:hypothetical protein